VVIGLFLMSVCMMASGQAQTERDIALSRAKAAMAVNVEKAAADPNRPAFHFLAPANWMNDPNGPILYKGWYHVFYQFNPYGDHWGNMHWGHARSHDLVNWEDMPVALWPSKSNGEDAIFSGSCFLGSGTLGNATPIAFYTSISDKRAPEQWSALPEDADLLRWHKSEKNPVLTSTLQEWRDPFLFHKDGNVYMVTGGGKDGRGIVALYKATDSSLQKWDAQGILFQDPDKDVHNIECPNFAKVTGGKWVLLTSVHGRVEYFLGDLDESLHFHPGSRGVLAEGSYASQLLRDKRGNLIHLAWVPTDEHVGWNGFLTLPSILTSDASGKLLRTPISTLDKLRTETYSISRRSLSGPLELPPRLSGDLLEIEAKVEFRDAKEFVVRVRQSADGSRAETLRYPASTSGINLHLFVDRGVVDEYLDGGVSTRVIKFTAKPEDLGVSLEAIGGSVYLKNLKISRLRAAEFKTFEPTSK
jgi:beta-fructofuranosidase